MGLLTYMSIRDEINNRISEKRLFVLPPLLSSDPVKRHMFVSKEVYTAVDPASWHRGDDTHRLGRLRADLDAFTTGQLIAVAEDPYKKPNSTYIARTDPITDDVWDIRSRDPRPGIRVLGGFVETDAFVSITFDYRTNLGGPGSKEWRDFIERCKAQWRVLFGTYPRHRGDEIHDYISENFYVV